MEMLFLKLLNLSINASILIVAVLLLRFVFKKAPKWINCLLWALVGIRLVIPFSLESRASLIPKENPIPATVVYQINPYVNSSEQVVTEYVSKAATSGSVVPVENASKTGVLLFTLGCIWLVGLVVMLSYSVISYLGLRRRLMTSTPFSKRIKQSDRIDSPFVLGVIRPTIYLPYSIGYADLGYVIAHEKAHIRRKDFLWKPLGFLVLSVYWFNPIVWIAYIILCRDIESACDEKVIAELDDDARRGYSLALLNCSIKQRSITACPVAFGENGVKSRIKGVMNYKKPAFWVIIIAVLTCIVVGICFITNPKSDEEVTPETSSKTIETTILDTSETTTSEEFVMLEETEPSESAQELKITFVSLNPDPEITNLLGFTDWEYDTGSVANVHNYIAFHSNEEQTEFACWFGFSKEPVIYVLDIDGDGDNEMICDCVYGADNVSEVRIYRNNNGAIEVGTVSEDYVCDVFDVEPDDICPPGILHQTFDPETNSVKMVLDIAGEASVDISNSDAFEYIEYIP